VWTVPLKYMASNKLSDLCGNMWPVWKHYNARKMAIPAARPAADDAIIMTYINTQRSSSKYTITASERKWNSLGRYMHSLSAF